MVVVAVEVRFWVAVMVASPPFSDMESVDRDRVTIGESSSTIVSAAPVTVGAGSVWAPLDILADMFNVLDDDVAVLLLAVMVTVPVLWVAMRGMIRFLAVYRVKSVVVAGLTGFTKTAVTRVSYTGNEVLGCPDGGCAVFRYGGRRQPIG